MTDYTTSIPVSNGFTKTYVETVTLRDQFAMAALTTIPVGGNAPKQVAEWAYEIADAMLETRKEKK